MFGKMPSSLALIAFLISQCLLFIHAKSSKPFGFTTNIIHINSIHSPFHNPNLTKSDYIRAAVRRSYAREQYYSKSQSNSVSPRDIATLARPEDLEYMMEYYIGKQTPMKSYGIIDTGSGIVWQQCYPCEGCPKQSLPLYDPQKSPSYVPLTCDEVSCRRVPDHKCTDNDLCQFEIVYGDGANGDGDIAYETLNFRDNSMKVGNFTWEFVVIGCSHYFRDPTPGDIKPPGIIGLDRSPSSLIQQSVVKHFTYCLGARDDVHPDGYIKFGDAASLRGKSTPIQSFGGRKNMHYYLNLEGISVDDNKLPISNDAFTYKPSQAMGGFIIDSGASYTLLNSTAFNVLVAELDKKLNKVHLKDADMVLPICYSGSSEDFVRGPKVTFHFTGVDLKLATWSTWVIEEDGIYCLGMIPTEKVFIFGNYQHQNVAIGYDLDKNFIYFNPMNSCSNLG